MSYARGVEDALAAAIAGDWSAVDAHLLAAWRRVRSPAIAHVILAVDAHLPLAEPVDAPKVADREAAWLALAADPTEAATRRLVATPWPAKPRDAGTRVDALLARAPSPRIAHALIQLSDRRLYATGPGLTIMHGALRTLLAQGEPLVTDYLATLDEVKRRELRLVIELPRPAIPSIDHELALARITALAATPSTKPELDELIAAIYTSPDDDGPRTVLADLLVEQGDPRGELITLQLARARGPVTAKARARERALLREAGDSWTRALAADTAFAIELERGFPARASIHAGSLTSPAWATVEELVLSTSVTAVVSDQLRALRSIRGLRCEHVAATRLLDPARLHHLDVLRVEGLATLATPLAPIRLGIAGVAFTELPGIARQLASWPIARRMTELVLASTVKDLPTAAALLAAAPQLAWVELRGVYSHLSPPTGLRARVGRERLELHLGGERRTETMWDRKQLLDAPRVLASVDASYRDGLREIAIFTGDGATHAEAVAAFTALAQAWPAPPRIT